MDERVDTGKGNARLALAVFGAAFAAAWGAWWFSLAPRPLPADAPASEFSAHRALEHIAQMAIEPHPGGSHANLRVREYIVDQLEAMGVEYINHTTITQNGSSLDESNVILARIRGTDSTGAYAADAHYDSTPYGPGAADDLSGIAAMLESIRALLASPPLKNDVIMAFTDEEENGGGGARRFIAHPWFEDVKVVLGLETRGTSGPAIMFETAEENGFVIRALARSDARPRATSIMYDFYKRMPFGSDFGKLKRHRPGLNVAYIDGFCDYHTILDNPENVSLASVQHHGYYTLELAREFGGMDLSDCRAPDATYFNTIGSHMIVYPLSWGWPLTIAGLVVFLAVMLFGFIRRHLRPLGVLAAMAALLGAALLQAILTVPLVLLTFHQWQEHALYRNNMYSAGLVLVGVACLVLVTRLLRGRVRPANMLAGALVYWAVSLAVFQVYVPGGAYAVLIPLVFGSVGLLVLLLAPLPSRPPERLLAVSAITALPALVLLWPALVMFTYTLTSLSAPVVNILVIQLLALLLPALCLMPLRRQAPAGLALLAAGALLYTTAFATNFASPTRPKQNSLAYAANHDTGEFSWVSADTKLDAFTSRFFNENTPRVELADFLGKEEHRYLKAPAPEPPYQPFEMRLLEDVAEGGRRTMKFHIDSPRDAQEIRLRLTSGVTIHRARAYGFDLESGGKGWNLNLNTMPFEGGELELEVDAGKPVEFHVREVSWQLPHFPELLERPPHTMAEPNRRLIRNRRLASERTYSIITHRF